MVMGWGGDEEIYPIPHPIKNFASISPFPTSSPNKFSGVGLRNPHVGNDLFITFLIYLLYSING